MRSVANKAHEKLKARDKMTNEKKLPRERGTVDSAEHSRDSSGKPYGAKTPKDPCSLTWHDLRLAPHTTQVGARVGGREVAHAAGLIQTHFGGPR